ncbi:MAG: protein of Unknown Function containing DUF928 domain [Phormidium sp. OSCR]|nr:MAG: protein of Unknown Function containing DUF928 domain [Phormidium sp. OSCR]
MKSIQASQLVVQTCLTAVLVLIDGIVTSSELKLMADPAIDEIAESLEIIFIPVGHSDIPEGPPETGDAAGSRGDCIATAIPLTHLVGHYGSWDLTLTTQEYPTFWFYVPYTSEEATSGEFSLQDSGASEEYWRAEFELPGNSNRATPGIVSITLPETVEPLEANRQYQWFFDLNCPTPETASNQRTTAASVYGLVERRSPSDVNPDFEAELDEATHPLEMAEVYAKNGIWFDALTQFAQVRLDYPDNQPLNEEWRRLLTSIGFGHISEEPLSGSVNLIE